MQHDPSMEQFLRLSLRFRSEHPVAFRGSEMMAALAMAGMTLRRWADEDEGLREALLAAEFMPPPFPSTPELRRHMATVLADFAERANTALAEQDEDPVCEDEA